MGGNTSPQSRSGQFELDFNAPTVAAALGVPETSERIPTPAPEVPEPPMRATIETVRSDVEAAVRNALEVPEKITTLFQLLESDHREYKWLFGMAAPVMKNIVSWRTQFWMDYDQILEKLRWGERLEQDVFNFLKWGSSTRSGEFLFKVIGCDPNAYGPYGQRLLVAIMNRKRAMAEVEEVGRDIEAIIDACGAQAIAFNVPERWNRTLLDFLHLSGLQIPLPKRRMSLERFLRRLGAKTGKELMGEGT